MQLAQTQGEWLERSQGSSSAPATLSVIGQRRRSSAAYRPAGPPPSQPIPNLPPPLDSQENSPSRSSFSRAPSAGLAAVAHFSKIRHTASAPAEQSPLSAADLADDLLDPPPSASLVPSSRMSERSHDSASTASRHLAPPSHEHRPSSRRALTRALELAREAVQLDSTNEDPEAAVQAYAQSVALLSEVMERVRRGEDSTETRRGRRRRSVAAQEEEVRRLQNIHDTYADRMNILSIIYSIPPVPYSTASLYPSSSVSSTNNNSPTTSAFPSSENSPLIPPASYTSHQLQSDAQYNSEFTSSEPSLPVGSPPLALDESVLTSNIAGLPTSSSSQHPYAAVPQTLPHNSVPVPPGSRTIAPLKPRPRASSQLPPQTLPPDDPLPPPPPPPPATTNPLDASIQKFQSEKTARRQSNLQSLEEEADDTRMNITPKVDDDDFQMALDTPRNKRDSHPLPPIPSPSSSAESTNTPRTSVHLPKAPPSPRGPRRPSVNTRSDILAPPTFQPAPIINTTTSHGTIHQRRTKTSLPSRSASPADSTLSSGSVPSQKQQPPLPAVPTAPLPTHTGRTRSFSQPGRRPSVVDASIEQRPPLPPSAGSNLSSRKPSLPSKPSASTPMQPSGDTNSPQIGALTPSFAAPIQFVSMGIVPFVPASHLPPSQPSDPLRKPYYMMELLAVSMTSPTGGYISRRLHVPNEVWTFGGDKLSNVPEKIRALEFLHAALSELQTASSEVFGAGNVSSGMAMGIGSIGLEEANAWLLKLEEFSNVCDNVANGLGKKIGVGEGFVLKKTTWGDKLSRRFEKFANGKNVDSPAAYVHSLKKFFQDVQLLDEHTKAVFSQPVAPAYAAFPNGIRTSTEQKLKRASEFFASVVLAFVIRDLALLLDKYVKKCEKILED
ncbi:hypothetical protein D9756_003942 [Leucocoprinus leucothites]|uniref:MIT domain-containing protein n=1 Tax=Leucocoprinus leucothites TaxID=201217 RepID=A0A8H5G0P6_9AGAR|nr:hypothetical protein D9756_003942 [Leucoagaricus leucothites]